jgi:hypothetical protein
MLPRKQGGDRVRYAPLLALFGTCIFLSAGCRRPPEPPAAHRFVRIEALLSLHPAWEQVTSLDRTASRFPAAKALAIGLHWQPSPLPAPFTPPDTFPKRLAEEREQRIKEDAARYVAQLERSLNARRDDLYRRAERGEKRQLQAAEAQVLATTIARMRALNEVQALGLQRKIDTLGYRDAALVAQISYYNQFNADQLIRDAQSQVDQVRRQIRDLTAQRQQVLEEDVRPRAEQAIVPEQKRLRAESDTRLKQRLTELDANVQQQIAQEKARLQQEPAPIKPLAELPIPPFNARATPLILPPAPPAAADIGQAQAVVDAGLARQQKTWQAQRANLVSMIRADTVQAVMQIARQKGWKPVIEGRPFQPDATSEVAAMLRAQWHQGAQP